jgi:hypothetical protein
VANSSVPAWAQNQNQNAPVKTIPTPVQTVPGQTAESIPPQSAASLEERYNQCINTAVCPLQVRLQIVQEENDDMNTHFHKVFETCASGGFQNCVNNQMVDMSMWHSADYRMNQMMLSIEAQSMALKEGAAGGTDPVPASTSSTPADQRSWWERLLGE